LHAQQIRRWAKKVNERGFTVVPLEIYFKGQHVKVEIALVHGRSSIDKRQHLREEDDKREIERAMKSALRSERRK
jgi:SsrA-binding protein